MLDPRDVPDLDMAPFVDTAPFVIDTDGDGRLDTSVVDDGVDLIFGTDLNADGVVDQLLRLGPDGVVRVEVLDTPTPWP